MKEVTLKVNGSLYVTKSYSNNFAESVLEARPLVDGMKSFEERIDIEEIVLDKDIELSGEVFLRKLTIPDGVRFRILCAKNLTFLV